MNRAFYPIVLVALLCLGCTPPENNTFAGFTFGGGGHTFSAEPAKLQIGPETSSLVAGSPDQSVYLYLEWPSESTPFQRKPVELSKTHVKVESRGESTRATRGEIVLQARDEKVGHGSFDYHVKLEDGREFQVVGSFTALIEQDGTP